MFGFIRYTSQKYNEKTANSPSFSPKKSDSCLFNCLAFFSVWIIKKKKRKVYQTSNGFQWSTQKPLQQLFLLSFHLLDLLVANLRLLYSTFVFAGKFFIYLFKWIEKQDVSRKEKKIDTTTITFGNMQQMKERKKNNKKDHILKPEMLSWKCHFFRNKCKIRANNWLEWANNGAIRFMLLCPFLNAILFVAFVNATIPKTHIHHKPNIRIH